MINTGINLLDVATTITSTSVSTNKEKRNLAESRKRDEYIRMYPFLQNPAIPTAVRLYEETYGEFRDMMPEDLVTKNLLHLICVNAEGTPSQKKFFETQIQKMTQELQGQ